MELASGPCPPDAVLDLCVVGRLRHEAGQTVVLFAVLLPLFLGLGAIAVDVGYWYVVKKTAQDAADAAALAAVRELPDWDQAELRGLEYVRLNLPDYDDATVEPYVPREGPNAGVEDQSKVEVTVTQTAATFFGRLFGVLNVTVSRRAVAERLDSPGNLAIHSHTDECGDGLRFNAENVSLNGLVHSNGQFRIDVGPFWAADGTINKPRCAPSVDETATSRFGDDPSATLPRDDVERPWPTWYTPAQFGWFDGCTREATTIRITSSQIETTQPDQTTTHGGTIPSGTYCARESLVIDAKNVTGTITALAPQIAVDGRNQDFTPFLSDVLFFAVPNADNTENDGSQVSDGDPSCVPDEGSDMTLDGSGHEWRGVIFSPCGRVVVNLGAGTGGSPAFEGAILALRVKVEGDDFAMTGRGDFDYNAALVE